MSLEDFSRKYFDLLTGEYAGINLTRINDYEEFYAKQIVDSVYPVEQSNVFQDSLLETSLMMDVGFGGGFPILPLAWKYPKVKFLGVEARAKKAKVVSEIATKLGVNNTCLHHARVETINFDKPIVITLKAVGKVGDFLAKINTTTNVNVFFYKGPNFYDLESEQLEKVKKEWEIIEEKLIEFDGVEKRYLIGFKNKNVPHRTKNNGSNKLVKLSELL